MLISHFTFSPACALSFVITAVIRGELAATWAWREKSEAKADPEGYKDHPIIQSSAEERVASLVPPENVISGVTTEDEGGDEGPVGDEKKKSRKRVKKRRG
jgi:hypothetical protein